MIPLIVTEICRGMSGDLEDRKTVIHAEAIAKIEQVTTITTDSPLDQPGLLVSEGGNVREIPMGEKKYMKVTKIHFRHGADGVRVRETPEEIFDQWSAWLRENPVVSNVPPSPNL